MMQIEDYGPVKTILLPDGWVELPAPKMPAGRSLKEFAPPDQSGVKLCFFYRGEPVSAETGAIFNKVLNLPPHTLSKEELACLKEILRERTDPEIFTVLKSSTEVLNGKRILLLIGTYKQTGHELYELFMEADETGRLIYEIYIIGPTQPYRVHLKEVKPALATLKWTDESEQTIRASAAAEAQ
jgi:hypothetical protein